MPQPLRVRLGDGSVIDLSREDLRSWYESGLIAGDTQVQKAGSRDWTTLGKAVDIGQWRKPAPARGVSVPAVNRKSAGKPGSPRAAAPEADVARTGPRAHVPPLPLLRYATYGFAVLLVAGAVLWSSAWWHPLIFGTAEQRRVRAATTSERSHVDAALGLKVDLPRGWSILRPDHGFFTPPANTRLSLAEPKAGAFGYLAIDTPARGHVSLDAYLDRVFEERRAAEPSLNPLRREDAPGEARRIVGTRRSADTIFESVATVWKDGWTYYALVVWGPAGKATGAAEDLRQGITMQGHMAARLRQAIEAVTAEVPLLTPAAAELLMGQSQAQALDPTEAFRRTYLLAGRGLPSLSAAEQREVGALSTELYARVPAGDRARLGPYLDRVRGGRATEPATDQQMSRVVKAAVLKMPAARRQRLQALFEKAIGVAVTSTFG
jgi:hypothetical protein